jgi:hypothetical protein
MTRTSLVVLAFALICHIWAYGQCPKNSTQCVTVIRTDHSGVSASTTSDNEAHAQAVGNAVQSKTTDALNFFLIEVPELQRAYNERINRAEGRFTPLYENLDLLTTIPVPHHPSTGMASTSRLKHHQLGETWPEFLMTAPLLAANVQKSAQEKRPGLKSKKTKFLPCSTVWSLIDSPSGSSTFDCLTIDRISGKDMLCRDLDGEVAFVNGKLGSLKVAIADDWETVYNELCDRFGPPSAADELGAFAIWNTPDLHLIASNSADAVGVSWMDETHLKSAVDWASQVPRRGKPTFEAGK